MKIEGDTLVIRVDLTQREGISGSGKTMLIASGNEKMMHGDIRFTVGINVYTKQGMAAPAAVSAGSSPADAAKAAIAARVAEDKAAFDKRIAEELAKLAAAKK